MPGIHRDGDSRSCGASTIVSGQSTVYCNGHLAAVDGDAESHGAGNAEPIYGALNVYINGKRIIVAPGDTAYNVDLAGHPPGADDPATASPNVFAYG